MVRPTKILHPIQSNIPPVKSVHLPCLYNNSSVHTPYSYFTMAIHLTTSTSAYRDLNSVGSWNGSGIVSSPTGTFYCMEIQSLIFTMVLSFLQVESWELVSVKKNGEAVKEKFLKTLLAVLKDS